MVLSMVEYSFASWQRACRGPAATAVRSWLLLMLPPRSPGPALPAPAEVWRHCIRHQCAAGTARPLVCCAPDCGRLPGRWGGFKSGMHACMHDQRPRLMPFTARLNWRLTTCSPLPNPPCRLAAVHAYLQPALWAVRGLKPARHAAVVARTLWFSSRAGR